MALSAPGDLLRMALELLPPGYRETEGGNAERSWELTRRAGSIRGTVDGTLISASPDPAPVVRAITSDLELWVAEHSRPHVFIHAGCVVHRGRAIVLPGRSMAGKSSLTAALLRAGATYWSDEYAVIDSKGLVRPYPRPLSIRPYDGSAAIRRHATDYSAPVGRGARPIGIVAALRYQVDSDWAVEPISPAHGVLQLVDNAVAARSRPRAVIGALSAACIGAINVMGTRGDADDAAKRLLELLD